MKVKIFTLIPVFLMTMAATATNPIYETELNTIDGKEMKLDTHAGDVLLIVNTASECGYTPQYKGLQELHEAYAGHGVQVLGFPANNFGGQEPGSDEEIVEFCEVNYGVEFQMFSKVSVKGDDIHPLFEHLTTAENEDFTGEVKWNFEKFLVDRNGNLVRRFRSNVEPMDEQITAAIEDIL